MAKFLSILSIITLTFLSDLSAQAAIRFKKPQNKFLFVGLNTQVKNLDWSAGGKEGFEYSNANTRNLLFLQFQLKNKQLLQKGYVKKAAFSSFVSTLNHETDVIPKGELTSAAFSRLRFRLNFLAIFATKWDRTTFSVGTRGLFYGHNPRIDPFFSFMPTQARADLGFNNDMGVFFRTPMSEKWDLEASATLGGFWKTPPLGTKLLSPLDKNASLLEWSKEKYKGTFLATSRIGTPVFNKNEYGFYLSTGRIVSPFTKDKIEQILRIGVDYTHKIRDGVKFTQQISFGPYHTVNVPRNPNFSTLNLLTGFDALFFGRILFSTNNAYRLKIDDGNKTKNGSALGSLGWVFNPNNQIRTNFLLDYDADKKTKNNYGFFVQVICGFGQR